MPVGTVLGFPGVDPSDAAVGARLRRWREERGWSVEDMARLLDMTPEEDALSRSTPGFQMPAA